MFQSKQYNQFTIYHANNLYQKQGVVHGFSSRIGGYSSVPYQGLNLGLTSGDAVADVQKNRIAFASALGILPEQVVSGL